MSPRHLPAILHGWKQLLGQGLEPPRGSLYAVSGFNNVPVLRELLANERQFILEGMMDHPRCTINQCNYRTSKAQKPIAIPMGQDVPLSSWSDFPSQVTWIQLE